MKKILMTFGFLVLLTASINAQTVAYEKVLAVSGGSYSWYTYNFTAQNQLKGRFRAQGGGRNNIRMMIMDLDDFENWKNSNRYSTYYDSGSVTVANFDVVLNKGSYVMVFDNSGFFSDAKAVSISFYR